MPVNIVLWMVILVIAVSVFIILLGNFIGNILLAGSIVCAIVVTAVIAYGIHTIKSIKRDTGHNM